MAGELDMWKSLEQQKLEAALGNSSGQPSTVGFSVNEFAQILQNPAIKLEQDDFYVSRSTGRKGYRANLCLNGMWYWYSVSNSDTLVSPHDVAAAIMSPSRRVRRSGPYKGDRGFEATVICKKHSYMLGHGKNKWK
jgi:hypothetical protein